MSMSFLDVLSCGLAAVIIILMLSLNSGYGEQDKRDEATYLELIIHGGTVNEFVLSIKNVSDTAFLEDKESYHYLKTSGKMDTLAGIRVTAFDRISPLPAYRDRVCCILQISIPPMARGLNMQIGVSPLGDKYAVEYSALHIFQRQPKVRRDTCDGLNAAGNIYIRYLDGTKVWLQDHRGEKTWCTFPFLTSQEVNL